MRIEVRNRCDQFDSYRAARVHSLFNADGASGANFSLDAELDIDDGDWKLGVVVGPSGSGKTSIGRRIFGTSDAFYAPEWPDDAPIVDAIDPAGDFDAVTGALAAVGLGSVPSWLRPYGVLSMGERFRADLARLVCEAPPVAVVDEFTSVVDRQIARFGALAFAKAWRRTAGKAVLLTPHYDVVDWLEPDWVLDTASGEFRRGRGLWRRPRFELEIVRTDWRYWPEFEPHHYLKLPRMIGACCYVGTVEGERVVHMGMSTMATGKGRCEARGCRLVVKPEWQGAGVGLRFLNAVCQLQLDGAPGARLSDGRSVTTMFHTSHPGLCAALRRDPNWRQTSAILYGANKRRSASPNQSAKAKPHTTGLPTGLASGFGGHLRAVQGYRYYGQAGIDARLATSTNGSEHGLQRGPNTSQRKSQAILSGEQREDQGQGRGLA